MSQRTMFKFDSVIRREYPPMPDDRRGGLGPASILDPFIREAEHRSRSISEPPNGYGSITVPKRAVVDQDFLLRVVFPPTPFDSSDSRQANWSADVKERYRNRFPTDVEVQTTKALDVSPARQSIDLGTVRRIVAADFLVRGTIAGQHVMRLALKYPQQSEGATFSFSISVRSKLMDKVQKLGIVAALVVTILTILKLGL